MSETPSKQAPKLTVEETLRRMHVFTNIDQHLTLVEQGALWQALRDEAPLKDLPFDIMMSLLRICATYTNLISLHSEVAQYESSSQK